MNGTRKPEHIVAMLLVTRRAFRRALRGIPDREAMVRVGGMNSVSWIVTHVAWQEDTFWRYWAQGLAPNPRLVQAQTGAPPSVPEFQQALADWREVISATEPYLGSLSAEALARHPEPPEPGLEQLLAEQNLGTLVVRCLMHYWSHIGEISAIRSLLGIAGPEFVGNLRGCRYEIRTSRVEE